MTLESTLNGPNVSAYRLEDDGAFPNNAKLDLLLYRDAFVFEGRPDAALVERVFEQNDWWNGWRNGVFPFHHYHSTAHEVLGCYGGAAEVQFGGPGGPTLELRCGDAVVIPAGVSHKNLGSSDDFRVVGAYAGGRSYDMMYGKDAERPRADEKIAQVPLPAADPLYGAEGPLGERWGGG